MYYREEFKDLFSLVGENYYFVQCISADFKMSRGIALKFNEYFNTKDTLIEKYSNYLSIWENTIKQGFCIKEGRTLNLVTTRRYWEKPTYEILQNSLNKMKDVIIINDIHKIAFPIICCGLDELDWNIVSQIIQNTFIDLNIEIFICKSEGE